MKYLIKGWIKNSFCDWDSKVSSVIFLPGCNMRCQFCQNWQIVENYQNMEDIEWNTIKEYLVNNKDFIDGLVITGGEPFISKFIFDLIDEVKQMKIPIKIDTNGTFPEKLKYLIDKSLVDFVAMDIKNAFEPELYSKTCGINISEKTLEKILESTMILMNSNIDYEFRTTLVRAFHTPETIKKAAERLKGAKKYVLQQFRKIGVKEGFDGGKPFSKEEMEDFKNEISENFERCYIRYYGTDT